jgi:NodT family efflux transporter outer membrane factor (OMF) lipoprotein
MADGSGLESRFTGERRLPRFYSRAWHAVLAFGTLSACAVGPNYHSPKAPRLSSYVEGKLPARTVAAPGPGGASQRFIIDQQIRGDWWSLFHSRAIDTLVATALRNNPSLAAAQNALLAARDQVRAEQGSFFPAITGSFQAERVHSGLSSGSISTGASSTNTSTASSGTTGTGTTGTGTTGTGTTGTGTTGTTGTGTTGTGTTGTGTTGSGTTSTSSGRAGTAGSGASTYALLNASVAVSYTPDIFGGVRRTVENYRAQAQDQRFVLEATYLSLTANVVTAAINDASYTQQIASTRSILRAQINGLNILKRQAALGGIAEAAVLTQEAQVDATRATLPPLESSLAQERNQLAAYEGIFPDQFHMPDLDLEKLILPGSLPVSLPSSLVRQRPDIRQYAALLHEATANVGIATANMLPQLTLTVGAGHEAFSAAQLFTPQSLIWNLVSGVTQPIFEGGTLLFRRRLAIAQMHEAAANYENTVVLAFQNVSDVLLALNYDALTLDADTAAEASARSSLAVTQSQFRLGGISFTSVLTAEQTYDNAVITRIRAQAQRYADTAALFQALGGGWWNRRDVSPSVQSCCGILP